MKKIIKIISVFLCLIIAFNTVSVAAVLPSGNKKPDALSVDVVHGIVAGETIPIHAFSDGILLKNITLTSSNPSVISCSPDGHITGEKAGESADITCTSQDGSSKTFTVYCVRAVYPPEECSTNTLRTKILAQPKNGTLVSIHLNFNILFNFLSWLFQIAAEFGLLNAIITPNSLQPITTGNFKVCGQYGNYAYIRFDDTPSSDGFIEYTDLNKNFDEFLYISKSKLTIKAEEEAAYLTADYYGNVTWEVENDKADDGTLDYENSIIDFDPGTGKIKAKKGGITSIRATANGMGRTCDIVSIYMWPQEWKVTAEKKITLYEHPDIVDINYEINEGDTFWVVGDLGGSNSWCYINRGSQAFPEYSYAKIEDFSTKGTISQYNEMNFRWPLKNTSYNYINSPYGTRDKNPTKHKGFDISTNWDEGQANIKGQTIVSAFEGTVDYVCINSSLSWGYCVSVISDKGITDPVSEKQFVAIYMHMNNKPKVSRGKEVPKETELGYVGNTGNSTGPHLHFEVNNKTASIYELNGKEASDEGRNSYNDLINPIFFYISFNPKYNKGSEAEKNHNGTFWYGSE